MPHIRWDFPAIAANAQPSARSNARCRAEPAAAENKRFRQRRANTPGVAKRERMREHQHHAAVELAQCLRKYVREFEEIVVLRFFSERVGGNDSTGVVPVLCPDDKHGSELVFSFFIRICGSLFYQRSKMLLSLQGTSVS